MTAPQPALIPPDPSVSGWYWLKNEGHPESFALWKPGYNVWTSVRGIDWTPEALAATGYTFASPTPRPLPTSEQMDAVYALTAPPKSLAVSPAGAFAIGYHAGMEYAARKLAQALEAKP
jgi:hypothetical protein